jgi:predicted N-acetyltransferase YhbS
MTVARMTSTRPSRRASTLTPALRAISPEDADAAGAICHAAFKAIAERHGFPPDFPEPATAIELMKRIISRAGVHGIAADMGGRLVGSNFLWVDDDVAGIGPITVDPVAQDLGVGRGLMDAVIERARASGVEAVRLVQAAYHGRSLSLYSKLGFAAREPLSVFQGPPLAVRSENIDVRPATLADMDEANALYRRIHGHTRSGALHTAIREGSASVAERGGRITGYTTGIAFFGHAVGETSGDVQALIAAAPSFGGPGFLVPTRNAALMRWCLRRGLRIVQPMTLMTMGPYQEPQGAYLPSVLY